SNSERWARPLASVSQGLQIFPYLYQQAQGNTAYHPNAKFHFYQVKGNLMVLQVGAVVYCLDADNGKVLWHEKLVDNLAQPGLVLRTVQPDQDGYLQLVMWNQTNGQQSTVQVGHVGAVQASHVALVTH